MLLLRISEGEVGNARFDQTGKIYLSAKRARLSTDRLKCFYTYVICTSLGTPVMHSFEYKTVTIYEGWNFNFGNTPLDWIQELLE